MKYWIGCASLALLAGCGSDNQQETAVEAEAENAADDSSAAEAPAFEMPFGLGMAPDTRLINGSNFKVGTMNESIASLATTGTGQAALAYYEAELTKAGWEIYSRGSNPDRPTFAAKKDDLRITGSLFESGEELEEGETDVRLIGKYPD